ncbi:MAG: Potassium channel [Claussenomyces sp. TS43310]|nr:MAG: Potassium channel [Claussenomyces sp. TS43310]
MNDPGLDGPIGDEVRAELNRDEEQVIEDEEQAFLNPSRWWFASTAFPLIAGTFGPMASAFSVCALVVHWRMAIPAGGSEANGIYIEDPGWLIGINAAQLAIAIISNLFLLLNMARRVRFAVAQPVTIIGWYISSFALVGLTATAAGPLKLASPPNHAFTQAFYYAIMSAGLYFLVATLMVVTVYGAYAGHYDKEFKLTMSQRTLMLQTISFLIYLLSGAAVYARVEKWNYLDAVYWADFTLLTIGIGDFAPTTHTGRGLIFPFAIGGIIILGLVIGSIRSLVLERGKVKMEARMIEKERRRTLTKVQKSKTNLLVPIGSDDPSTSGSSSKTLESVDGLTERERRKFEFELMRRVQDKATARRRWSSLAISATTWLVLWFAGAAIFRTSEVDQGWSYFVALYFSYTSLLTIGYGDFSPTSNSGKPFFVFWSLLAIPSLTILISNMGDTIVKGIRDLTLWIGEFTILPGEHGARVGMKQAANRLTHGKIFSGDIEEQPAGILGETQRHDVDGGGDAEGHVKNDPESAAQRVASDQAEADVDKAQNASKDNDKEAVPKSPRHYHLKLIEEIGQVMKHLNSSPPRKYTFDEWAWYLKLIGEDESSAETHRRAPKRPKPDGEGLATATGDKSEDGHPYQWSWIGNRSPLMGDKEEAQWVLERLTRTLNKELNKMRKEELEGTGDWANGKGHSARKA